MDRIAFLQDFIKANPHDLFSRHALAMELIKNGEDAKAREILEEILLIDPTYVGSYYHLGKLMERLEVFPDAIKIYQQGMAEAEKQKDHHALRELKAALNQLQDELEY